MRTSPGRWSLFLVPVLLVGGSLFYPFARWWSASIQTADVPLILSIDNGTMLPLAIGLVVGAVASAALMRRRWCIGDDRKRTQEALLRAEREWQRTFNSVPDMITVMDRSCHIVRVNRSMAERLGMTPEQCVGLTCHESVHGLDHMPGFCPNALTLADGKEHSTEVYEERLGGCFLVTTSPIFDEDHRLVGTVHVARDVTDCKRMEKELLEFKTAVEQSVDGIALTDLNGIVRFVNRAWAGMHGFSVEESIGQHLGVFHTKEQLENEVTPFNEELQKTGSRQGEVGHVRKDGTVFRAWMSSTLLKDADNKPFGFIGIARNITEYKRAEDILRKSEAMLSCIFNSIPHSIFWKDAQSVFLGCNEVFAEQAGLRPADIVGKTDFDLPWSPEESAAYRADDAAVMTSGRAKRHIVEKQHQPDGTCIWIDTTKIPLRDSQGNVYGVLGIYENITERKQMEDELHRARDAAQATTELKSQFLANMSHEIRTPMTAILGYTDILSEGVLCCSTCSVYSQCTHRGVGHDAIDTIRRNGEHLLALINDILDLSKIEAGKLRIDLTPFSPAQLLDEVVSLMRPLAAAKQLELKTEISGALPDTVITDPIRLRQVLVNIVGNAIKFTDRGEVLLSTRWIAEAPPRLQFEVTDTGTGMNDEQVANLFKPFVQVDNSAKRKFGGTGLGLCISKLLAEALGGDILVRSAPGVGSTFVVTTVPSPEPNDTASRSPQQMATHPQLLPASVPAGKIALHGRILLAEDGVDNQRLIAFLLRRAGAEVSMAENGQLAIDAVLRAREAGQPFDVILMDMQMPVLDGYEATRRLRAMDYTGPILALTAYAMSQDRQACLDAGCNDYLTKPIDRRRMLETIAKHLPSKETNTEVPARMFGASE